jgi:hypothetical protein
LETVQGENCGDGICNALLGENCLSCTSDCACTSGKCCLLGSCISSGQCSQSSICSNGELISHCGDTTCNCDETCSDCESDCGECVVCGDSKCTGGETYATCPADCQTTCGDSACAGSETCTSCPNDCKKCNGIACSSGSECQSGNCVDGYCCDLSCTSTCKSCNVAGYLGTCYNDPVGTSCGTGQTCDINGNCVSALLPNGQSCSSGSECQSTFCKDGYCCDSSCTSTCKSCNVAGHLGTCYADPAETDPDNQCAPFGSCTSYLYGWDNSGTSCRLYIGPSSHDGLCNGYGSCYSSAINSCEGIGSQSGTASCGSSGCSKSCPAGGLGVSYDTVAEVCYTSGAQNCLANYYWVNLETIYNAWVNISYDPEYGPNCDNPEAVGWEGYFIQSTRPITSHIWSSYYPQEGVGPIWKFRCSSSVGQVCDLTGTCV